jgi:hypothetical protein
VAGDATSPARTSPRLALHDPVRYMDKAPRLALEWDSLERYVGVGFRMVNRSLTHQRLSNGIFAGRAEGVYS